MGRPKTTQTEISLAQNHKTIKNTIPIKKGFSSFNLKVMGIRWIQDT